MSTNLNGPEVKEPIVQQSLSEAGRNAADLKLNGHDDSKTRGFKASTTEWSPSSWTTKPIKQDVVYDDRAGVERSIAKLEHLPPLVSPAEIIKLRRSLKEVALGKSFLLQGGDCAELFDYCQQDVIESKIKLLLQMSLILIWGANKPVVRIARMAGQYAKPRSSPMENYEGRQIHSFRGDILNGYDIKDRVPDPERLVSAYFHSAATLNFVRSSISSGIADLHSPLSWELGHVKEAPIKAKYEHIVDSITESLQFMRTVGADTAANALETVDLFTSHEALLLEYEQSLTRKLPHPASHRALDTPSSEFEDQSNRQNDSAVRESKHGWYNTSAHFVWIGDRTRQLSGAHIEYIRGIENPIGLKVGPTLDSQELVALLDVVNPSKSIGKVTLITRYGKDRINDLLPGHIQAVRKSGHIVVWQCDPMHGNTQSTPSGLKTRRFSSVLDEVSSALRIHKEQESFLGGVHLELTGEAVTECIGGSEGITENDLDINYTTYCDPRLNEKQALELAFLIAGSYRGEKVNNLAY